MTEYTKFEQARMIGARALQISMGAPFLTKLNDEQLQKISYNPIEIAKMEFKEGIIPIEVNKALGSTIEPIPKKVEPRPFDQTKLE